MNNPVNMDTKGTCHSVRIIRMPVLSGLSERTSGTYVRAEDGTARSKQATSKKKKAKSLPVCVLSAGMAERSKAPDSR